MAIREGLAQLMRKGIGEGWNMREGQELALALRIFKAEIVILWIISPFSVLLCLLSAFVKQAP